MTVVVADSIFVHKTDSANIDAVYGPHDSIAEAYAYLVTNKKLNVSVTVGVKKSDGNVREYWVQLVDGEKKLVEKGVDAGTSGIYNKDDVDQLLDKKVGLTSNNIRAAFKEYSDSASLRKELEDAYADGDVTVAGAQIVVLQSESKDSIDIYTFVEEPASESERWSKTTVSLNLKSISVENTYEDGVQVCTIKIGSNTYPVYAPPSEGFSGSDVHTSLDNANNTSVPTTLAVKGALDTKANTTDVVKKAEVVASWQTTSDNNHVPGEKLVHDELTQLSSKVGNFSVGSGEGEYPNIHEQLHGTGGGSVVTWEELTANYGTANRYWNTKSLSVGSTLTGSATSVSEEFNTYAARYDSLSAGVYRLYGRIKSNLFGWVVKDSNNVITSLYKTATDYSTTPLEITISEGDTIYIQSDSGVHKVEKKVTTALPATKGIADRLEDVEDALENVTIKMLDGKKFVAFGDSITQFTDSQGKGWCKYFEEETGASVINCGIGGSRMSQNRINSSIITDSTAEGYSNTMNIYSALCVVNMVRAACGLSFNDNYTYLQLAQQFVQSLNDAAKAAAVTRLASIDWSTIDGVIILAGTNDYQGGANYGTSGDTLSTHTLGAINKIVECLLSTYKHLSLFYVTPLVSYQGSRETANFSDNFSSNGKTLKALSSEMAAEFKSHHIPVLDAYNEMGWNEWNFSKYFTTSSDSTHPYGGFKALGKKIASFVIANKSF